MTALPADGLIRRAPRLAIDPAWRGVFLSAGPGWGKSVVLGELATEPQAGAPAVPGHDLPAGGAVRPGSWLGRRVVRFEVRPDCTADPELAGQFEVASAGAEGGIILVDDLHHAGSGLDAALCRAVTEGRVFVAVASRLSPGPGWARLVATGLVGCWGPGALALDQGEAAAVHRLLVGREPPPDWEGLCERLAGWPLGVVTVARAIARDPERWSDGLEEAPELLFDLIEAEIWGPLPDGLREAARRAALLARPLVPILEALELPAQTVRELQGAHVLLPGRLPGELVFGPGIREFVASRASWPPAARREWHILAAGAWEDLEDWEAAIGHWLAASRPSRHLARGPVLPADWLAAFDPAFRATEPALLLWDSRVAFATGARAEAELTLEAAKRGFDARGDASGRFACHVVAATRALACGDRVGFERETALAAPWEKVGTPEDQVELLLAMGAFADGQTVPDRAAELAGAATALPPFGKREALLSRNLVKPAEASPPGAGPAAPTPAGLIIRALGEFSVRQPDGREVQWPRRKAKVVLGLLLLSPRGVDRLALAEALSRGVPGKEAEEGLRVAVHALRRAVEPDLERGGTSRFVLFENDRYRLTPGTVGSSDLADLESLLTSADRLRAAGDAPGAARAYMAAGEAFTGELFDEEGLVSWFEVARTALRNRVLEGLDFVAGHHSGRGEAEARELAARRMVAVAPTSEEAHRALIDAFLDAGRKDLARNQYWLFRRTLERHLGIQPSDDLNALFEG